MATSSYYTKSLAAASANNIATSQTPGSAALTINGAAATSGVATIDTASANNQAIGRRVIVTSGGDDTGITWTVVGTNASGSKISDTFAGVSGGAAQSNQDFVTVTSITPSGAVASTALAGTNGVGSSGWQTWNLLGESPMNLGFAVELVSGAVNFSLQYTYDDPNALPPGVATPLAFTLAGISAAAATVDASLVTPVMATRILINSGTGVIRVRALQAGIG
jgi:hypothetical protein